jgi:hypothetical protein
MEGIMEGIMEGMEGIMEGIRIIMEGIRIIMEGMEGQKFVLMTPPKAKQPPSEVERWCLKDKKV